MFKKNNMSYLISGILFLVIGYLGGRYFSWPLEAFAFLLLTYLIVIIGIRLDEIAGRLADIQYKLSRLQERRMGQ
jgi:membrane protein DedA with SNARE-associated domain